MTEEEVAVANGKTETENKSDDVSELEQCIIRQVEYYFGDINLPRDKFLKEQIELDEGWVSYETMLKFKRLAALTTDTDTISAALKKSKNQVVEVSEDGLKIRRSPTLPLPELNEERRKEIMTRTIYVKGLPKENTTLDDCLKFFQTFSSPENVIMRRYLDKVTKTFFFKGSLFVTFKTKEDAEEFLSKSSVKFGEAELIKKWQKTYLEEKQLENEAKYNKALEKKNAKQKEEEKSSIVLPRGTVLLLNDVPDEITRDNIKEAIIELKGEVGFIKIEDKKAWIRLQKEGTAKEVFEKITDGKLKVESVELTCELPEQDVENKFLDEMAEELMKRKQKFHKQKGGGRHYNRKRKGGNDNGPQSKRR